MKFTYLLLVAIFVSNINLLAQNKLPSIKANAKLVDIRDGNEFKKAYWTITPEAKPDIYKTSSKNKKVIFYTDVDSISFVIKENKKYLFYIILNGKDTALTQIEYMPSFLEILTKDSFYNYKQDRKIPAFTFQDKDNINLINLKNKYKLDSIVGEGNEISKFLNLLHWVHNFIPHDGNIENPVPENALNMIEVCKKDNRGLACGGLAAILNECYLSLGYKSRTVDCLPKDSLGTDPDSHVIVIVYSQTYQKWIWVDPTNDAYVMKENGELLSIEEVRQRLVNNKPLIVNPEANWNHKVSKTKEDYLYQYMAKNLYKLASPIRSEFGSRTPTSGTIVERIVLLPVKYFKQGDAVTKGTDTENNINYFLYRTNNPNQFWAKPIN